jgi:uncharacterized protein YigE (DUF2233 family)
MGYRRDVRRAMALTAAVLLVGCGHASQVIPTSSVVVTTTPPVVSTSPTPSSVIVTGETPTATTRDWQDVAAGVSVRLDSVTLASSVPAQVTTVRVAQPAGRLRVGYTPSSPRLISDWAAAHPTALVMINGGYFDDAFRTTSLLVSDGVGAGRSYVGFGGMLGMSSKGAVTIRSLRDHPYSPSEKPRQAVESFPMLVIDGTATSMPNDNGRYARRSIVAVDGQSRLLFITVAGGWTLPETATWLAGSGLGITQALNLDGGSSTGMVVQTPTYHRLVDAWNALPIVIWVEAA